MPTPASPALRAPGAHDPAAVELVILIPVYKHSVLLAEAIESALAQTVEREFHVVIVNDGCPHPETDHLAFALAQARPDVVYLMKRNGGPSCARNFGLDYVCETYPNLKAVFFLDADNRLAPNAMRAAWSLLDEHPDIGWIYPHIATFEVEWSGDYDIPYSRLLHVVHENLCDTGCLIRAELVRKLRFNPSARSGFEDWDFWLSAVAAGYRGLCSDAFGFAYRNRAESRFKEVSRSRADVTSYLRERYRGVFTPRKLLEFEHDEAPRFAFVDTEAMTAGFFTDPQRPWSRMTLQAFNRNFWSALQEPERFLAPNIMMWGSEAALRALSDAGLVHTVLWLIQRQLLKSQFVAVSLTPSPDEVDIQIRSVGADAPLANRIALIAGRRDIVASCAEAVDQGWIQSLASPEPGPDAIEIAVRAPLRRVLGAPSASALVQAMATSVAALAGSTYRAVQPLRWTWRNRIFPGRQDYPELLERYLRVETLLPRSVEPERADIGFVIPFGSFGGAEKVAYAAAAELRKAGFTTHLFVIGGKGYKIVPDFAGAFDTVNLVGTDVPALWGGGKTGRGTEFGTAEDAELKAPVLAGLLSTMDVVVNCQSAPLNAAIGDLRAQGIMTLSYIHLFDRSPLDRDVGHPFLGLMFEHAYDLFLTCSHQLRHTLHGLGIPAEKLMTVDNVPSFSIPAARRKAIRRQRETSADTLQVLFIGRLDSQKGLERIVGIAEKSKLAGLDIAFRFIGANIVEGAIPEAMRRALLRSNITLEPPVFASEQLTAALAAADAMILPSRWEGAPLIILEAQQAGCIPVATDVGAVSELITDGVDGVLLPNGRDPDVILDFIATLARLQADKDLRRRLAFAAMDRLAGANWATSFAPLVARLGSRFPKRARGAPSETAVSRAA